VTGILCEVKTPHLGELSLYLFVVAFRACARDETIMRFPRSTAFFALHSARAREMKPVSGLARSSL
jgi:hypothetical protein